MNTLLLFPEKTRKEYEAYVGLIGVENVPRYHLNTVIISLIAALIISLGSIIIYGLDLLWMFPFLILGFIVLQGFFYFKVAMQADFKIKRMEIVFPDVLQLIASNLRAGMTVDNSLVLSARPEFNPLDEEIRKTGKEIVTGRDIGSALTRMANRIGSDKIRKTIYLIISGLKSGGNLADLIEQTGRNMRIQEFGERKVSSGVLMYVIFIFFTVAAASPILFSLSTVLVQILITMLGGIQPTAAGGTAQTTLPFMLSTISISVDFIKYFSLVFMFSTGILASLVIGLVQDGRERAGLKYLIPIITISVILYFVVRSILAGFLAGSFGA